MSNAQLACALFAMPFLILSAAWMIGLAYLFRVEGRK